MFADLRYLIGTFDKNSRIQLALNVVVQFFLALMDLVGLAAIAPLMQLAMGEDINSGWLGSLRDVFGRPDRQSFALILAGVMVAAFVGKAVLASVLQWWSLELLTRLQTSTAKKLLTSYMSESYLEHRRRNTGEVIRTVGTANQSAHTGVLGGVLNVLSSTLSVVFIAVLLIAVMPVQAIAATVYFAVVVFVLQRVLAPANRRAGEAAQHTAWLTGKALIYAMHGFREATLHDARGFFIREFDTANVLNSRASRNANFLSQLPKIILELVTMIGLTILIVASMLAGNAKQTMPMLSLFVGATIKILPLMVALTATIGMIRVGRDGLRLTVQELKAMGQRRAEQDDERQARSLGQPAKIAPNASIEVRDMTFSYDAKNAPVLKDINLSIPAGSSLALCGPSGSGKTTLVDIILGLIAPTAGSVTYGGLSTALRDPNWLEAVAYVPQDVFILDETLVKNIAFGVPEDQVDRDKVRRCLERAQLLDMVDSLPDGIDTELGERGTRFSGGQRQRVGIARALYRDPKVMIFDEATSALDNVTEHKITQTVNSLKGEITTIIVAHRLSTVRDVDSLAFLQHGHIEALGTFEEVETASPAFARLVQLGRLDGAAEGS